MFKRFVVSTALVALFISTLPLTTTLADGPVLDPRHNAFVAMYGTGDWVGPRGIRIWQQEADMWREDNKWQRGSQYFEIYLPEIPARQIYYHLEVEYWGDSLGYGATRFPFNDTKGTSGFNLSETGRGNNMLISHFLILEADVLRFSIGPVNVTRKVMLLFFIQQSDHMGRQTNVYLDEPFTAGMIVIY